jgi:hypothetical protein
MKQYSYTRKWLNKQRRPNNMIIQITYYMTDGIDIDTPIGPEKTFTCEVKTFSDYRYIFGSFIMQNEPDNLYATIKSIKVKEFNTDWLDNN